MVPQRGAGRERAFAACSRSPGSVLTHPMPRRLLPLLLLPLLLAGCISAEPGLVAQAVNATLTAAITPTPIVVVVTALGGEVNLPTVTPAASDTPAPASATPPPSATDLPAPTAAAPA